MSPRRPAETGVRGGQGRPKGSGRPAQAPRPLTTRTFREGPVFQPKSVSDRGPTRKRRKRPERTRVSALLLHHTGQNRRPGPRQELAPQPNGSLSAARRVGTRPGARAPAPGPPASADGFYHRPKPCPDPNDATLHGATFTRDRKAPRASAPRRAPRPPQRRQQPKRTPRGARPGQFRAVKVTEVRP